MRVRRLLPLLLAALLLVLPSVPVRADETGTDPDSRVGVVMIAVCGLSLRASVIAPVPWAGIAFVTCLAGMIDAAMGPDAGSAPTAP